METDQRNATIMQVTFRPTKTNQKVSFKFHALFLSRTDEQFDSFFFKLRINFLKVSRTD